METSEKSKKTVAIECRSIEDKTWGVGRSTAKFLEEIYRNPEIADGLNFVLYFHRKIPDYDFLASPLFKKRVLCPGILRFVPFYIYYFVMVPIIAFLDRVYVTYYPNYMLPIIHLGKSIVVLTEDVYQEARKKDVGIAHRLGYIVFSTWASWFATKIMAVSETSRIGVAKLFKINLGRVFANPHGVDFKDNINAEINIKRDENSFLTFGQAFPRRHMKEVFEAFDKLAETNNKINLTAIGVDKYRPEILKDLAVNINARYRREVIKYSEYVSDEDLLRLFKQSIACIYVSFNEAFGIPPVEALANECLPVVADTAVTREIFDSHAIFVEEEHSSEAIKKAILSIYGDGVNLKSILSYSKVIKSKYTWKAHAQRLISQIEKL